MDQLKIENCERDQGPGSFIWFRRLPEAEALELFNRLKQRLSVPARLDGLNTLEVIRDRSTQSPGLNAVDEGFDLQHVLGGFQPPERVFLNWYRFDALDEVRFDDLRSKFNDVWYPSSDDLEVLDPNLGWILSIDHSGNIFLLDLSPL